MARAKRKSTKKRSRKRRRQSGRGLLAFAPGVGSKQIGRGRKIELAKRVARKVGGYIKREAKNVWNQGGRDLAIRHRDRLLGQLVGRS